MIGVTLPGLVLAILLAPAAPSRATVYEWNTPEGVRYLSNAPDGVPGDLPVRSYTAKAAPPTAVHSSAELPPPDAGPEAGPVEDDYGAYVRGIQDGLRLAQLQLEAARLAQPPAPAEPSPPAIVVTGGAPFTWPYVYPPALFSFGYGAAFPMVCRSPSGRPRACGLHGRPRYAVSWGLAPAGPARHYVWR
jgi:hypothetical protein